MHISYFHNNSSRYARATSHPFHCLVPLNDTLPSPLNNINAVKSYTTTLVINVRNKLIEHVDIRSQTVKNVLIKQ